MTNFMISFDALDRNANTRHNTLVVAADSAAEARASFRQSEQSPWLCWIRSITPTTLAAVQLTPLHAADTREVAEAAQAEADLAWGALEAETQIADALAELAADQDWLNDVDLNDQAEG